MIFNSYEESCPALLDACIYVVDKFNEFCKTNEMCVEFSRLNKIKFSIKTIFGNKKHIPRGNWVDWHHDILKDYIEDSSCYGFERKIRKEIEQTRSFILPSEFPSYDNKIIEKNHLMSEFATRYCSECDSYGCPNHIYIHECIYKYHPTKYIAVRSNPWSKAYFFYLEIFLMFDSSSMDSAVTFRIYIKPFIDFVMANGTLIDCVMPESLSSEREGFAQILFIPNICDTRVPRSCLWKSNNDSSTYQKIAVSPDQQSIILEEYKHQIAFRLVSPELWFSKILKKNIHVGMISDYGKTAQEFIGEYGDKIDMLCIFDPLALLFWNEKIFIISHLLEISEKLERFGGNKYLLLDKINAAFVCSNISFIAIDIKSSFISDYCTDLVVVPSLKYFVQCSQENTLFKLVKKLKIFIKKIMFVCDYVLPGELLYLILRFAIML